MNAFSLTNYSQNSEIFGFLKIDQIVGFAKANKMKSLGITDIGSTFSYIEFIKACEQENIKPILGVTFHISKEDKGNVDKPKKTLDDLSRGTITLIAKDFEGYKNINRLLALKSQDSDLRLSLIDLEDIKKHSEGLICISGNETSIVGKEIIMNSRNTLDDLRGVFQDDFYLEEYHQDIVKKDPVRQKINNELIQISEDEGIKRVANNQNRVFFERDIDLLRSKIESYMIQDVSKTYGQSFRDVVHYSDSVITSESMKSGFTPESLDGLFELDNKVSKYSIKREMEFTEFEWSKPEDLESFLYEELDKFFESEYFDGLITYTLNNSDGTFTRDEILSDKKEEYKDRLVEELEIIKDCNGKDFTKYFATFKGLKMKADELGEIISLRGSALSSFAIYLIIQGYKEDSQSVDPLYSNLLFQRFLNALRSKYPDIDSDVGNTESLLKHIKDDFMESRDDEVGMAYLVARTEGLKSMRDVLTAYKNAVLMGRELKKYFIEENLIPKENFEDIFNSKYVELENAMSNIFSLQKGNRNRKSSLKELMALDNSKKLNKFFQNINDNDKELYKIMLSQMAKLRFQVQKFEKSQGGIVMSNKNMLDGTLPLVKATSKTSDLNLEYQVMVNSSDIEKEMGLLKYDVLSSNQIYNTEKALKDIYEKHGKRCNTSMYLLEGDSHMKENGMDVILENQLLVNIFQVSRPNGRRIFSAYQPKNFNDLVNISALSRPGPDDYKFMKSKNSNNDNIINELDTTFGFILFEEQIIDIARRLGAFNAGEADDLRIMVKEKGKDKILEYKKDFISHVVKTAREHGANEEMYRDFAEKTFQKIEEMSGYTFNKGHAIRYAITAYQQMWIKVNYPGEFIDYMQLKESNGTKEEDKVFQRYIIEEIKHLTKGFSNLDINKMDVGFKTLNINGDKEIMFSLSSLLENTDVAKAIVKNRPENGFKDKDHFLETVIKSIQDGNNAKKILADFSKALPRLLGSEKPEKRREYLSEVYSMNALSSIGIEPKDLRYLQDKINIAISETKVTKESAPVKKSNPSNNYPTKNLPKESVKKEGGYKLPPKNITPENSDFSDFENIIPKNANSKNTASTEYVPRDRKTILKTEIKFILRRLNENGKLKIVSERQDDIKIKRANFEESNDDDNYNNETIKCSIYASNGEARVSLFSKGKTDLRNTDFLRLIQNMGILDLENKTPEKFIDDLLNDCGDKYSPDEYEVSPEIKFVSRLPKYIESSDVEIAKEKEEKIYSFLGKKRRLNSAILKELHNKKALGLAFIDPVNKLYLSTDYFEKRDRTLLFLFQDENLNFTHGQEIKLRKEKNDNNQPSKFYEEAKTEKFNGRKNLNGPFNSSAFRIYESQEMDESGNLVVPINELQFFESVYDTIAKYEMDRALNKKDIGYHGYAGCGGIVKWFEEELNLKVISNSSTLDDYAVDNINSKAVYTKKEIEFFDISDRDIKNFEDLNIIPSAEIKEIENMITREKENPKSKGRSIKEQQYKIPKEGDQREFYFIENGSPEMKAKVEAFNRAFKGKVKIEITKEESIRKLPYNVEENERKLICGCLLDESNFERFLDANNICLIEESGVQTLKVKKVKKIDVDITSENIDEIKSIVEAKLKRYFGENEIKLGVYADADLAGIKILPQIDLMLSALGIKNTSAVVTSEFPSDHNDVLVEYKKIQYLKTKELGASEGSRLAQQYLLDWENSHISASGISSYAGIANKRAIYSEYKDVIPSDSGFLPPSEVSKISKTVTPKKK